MMQDVGGRTTWEMLKSMKVEGVVDKFKREDLKKRIEQPTKKDDAGKSKFNNGGREEFKNKENADGEISTFGEPKGVKKSFKVMSSIIKENAQKTSLNEQKNITIRPEFDDLRGKIKDEMSEKIGQATRMLTYAPEEQMISAFAKSHAKIQKMKRNLPKLDQPKDFIFGPDDRQDEGMDVPVEDEDYVDFKELNQNRVSRVVKEQLNRVLPTEIENIQKLEEKNYIVSTDNKRKEKNLANKVGGESLEFSRQFEVKPNYQEDVIETYSVVADKANKLPQIPFYREIGPYARDIINYRNESKTKNTKLTTDLMNEKEFQIDDNNITFENIMNVVAGRISSKKLLKALPHLEEAEYLDEDSEDLNNMNELNFSRNEQFEEAFRQRMRARGPPTSKSQAELDRRMLAFFRQMQGQNYDYFPYPEDFDQDQPVEEEVAPEEPITYQDQSIQEQPELVEQSMQFPTPRPIEEIRKDQETQTHKKIMQLSTENENSESQRSEVSNVDLLLQEIESLKQAKSNSYTLPKSSTLDLLRVNLNTKIENKLTQLFYLIADDPERKSNLKDHLTTVIGNIHLLEGKVIDGHLKTNLLFQFLKEYKKLAEEKEQDRQRESVSRIESRKNISEDKNIGVGFSRNFDSKKSENIETYVSTNPNYREFASVDPERYNTRTTSPPRKKPATDKQNPVKSFKLPQPYEVRSRYMKQTQSSIRRLNDVKAGTGSKARLLSPQDEQQKDAWIRGSYYEDLSDDEDWVKIENRKYESSTTKTLPK